MMGPNDRIGINLPGVALIVIAVVLLIALFHGWG